MKKQIKNISNNNIGKSYNMDMKKIFGSLGPQHRAMPSGFVHHFYIFDCIGDPDEYVPMISIMDEASESDVVHLYLNTPGGNLASAISIIHAIMRTEATVIAHADGDVASAGTLIFFACQHKAVYPYASFMFHDGSGILDGKINESMKSLTATNKLVKNLLGDLYFPFFSEEEIDEILEGKDVHLDAEEMTERLEAGEKILEEMMKEENDEEEQAEDNNIFITNTSSTTTKANTLGTITTG